MGGQRTGVGYAYGYGEIIIIISVLIIIISVLCAYILSTDLIILDPPP